MRLLAAAAIFSYCRAEGLALAYDSEMTRRARPSALTSSKPLAASAAKPPHTSPTLAKPALTNSLMASRTSAGSAPLQPLALLGSAAVTKTSGAPEAEMSRSWQRAASLRSAHASASGGKWRVNAKWTASNSWAVRRSTIQHLEGGIAKGSRVCSDGEKHRV